MSIGIASKEIHDVSARPLVLHFGFDRQRGGRGGAPDIVRFDHRKDYSPDYLAAVARLSDEADSKGFAEVKREAAGLTSTLARQQPDGTPASTETQSNPE